MFKAFELLKVGPSQEEVSAHRGNIHDLQTNLAHKEALFTAHLPDLLLPMPDDKHLAHRCQNGLEFKIEGEKYKQASLTDKKVSVDDRTAKTNTENALQQSMHASAVDTVNTHIDSGVRVVDTLLFQILSIPQVEIIHTRIYDDICKLGNIDKFDLLLSRTPDINGKNAKGRSPIDFATIHSFEHGIRELIKTGSETSGAFVYSLHLDLRDSAKLLTIITGELKGYISIFNNLKTDNKIIQLDLSDCNLSTNAIEQLSSALAENTFLKELNISRNQISIEAAYALSDFLKSNKYIALLDLSHSNLCQEGMLHIAGALQKHKGIKILNIAYNNLEEEGGIRLSSILEHNNSILEIDVSSNNLADIGAAYLIDRMIKNPSILKLSLNNNSITDDLSEDIIECIPQSKRLIAFSLQDNNFSSSAQHKIQQAVTQTLIDNAF